MSSSELKIAYLREFESGRCDIRFVSTFKTIEGESKSKEIIGFCATTDTLAILKKSIVDKILSEINEKEEGNGTIEENLSKLSINIETIEVDLLHNEKPYRESILLKDFVKLNDEKILTVFGEKYNIVINAPLIRVLLLPPSVCADFPVEPLTFKTINLDKKATKFIWYRSLDKVVWEKVGEGYAYDVREEDANFYLKLCCVPYSQFKVKGPVCEVITESKVDIISVLPKCPFEERHRSTVQALQGDKIRVVSYNILAERYVDTIKFSYCPSKYLGIHYRKQLIMKELNGYNADIICLQEVDELHYNSYYKNQLVNKGYKSYFNRKGNCIAEGMVCAFRENRFKKLEAKQLVLRHAITRKPFEHILALLRLNKDIEEEFLRQHTSVQTTVLQDKNTKKIIVVGNVHLYYHPDANHIRLLQASMAAIHLNHTKNRIMREYKNNRVGIIFCGDFNSDSSKSLLGFMICGTIDPEHEDCLKLSPLGDARIYHQLYLTNASGTPKYTNYTADFAGCLDYIFIEKRTFSVSEVIPVPTEQELQKYEGLPNEVYPSDHVALVVNLQFNCR